jgi:hypothetical protein
LLSDQAVPWIEVSDEQILKSLDSCRRKGGAKL